MNSDYKRIIKNKKKFEHLLSKINNKNDLSENLIIANLALLFAVKQNTGYYVSNKLETFYCDCAKQIHDDLSDVVYEKGTVLHVATLTCNVGGHSRVIERWIELAPDNQKHSVVLLNQTCEIPQKLKANIANKNGKLHIFETTDNILEKAKKLRKLSMQYEYIVLHIHMEDPTAVIAFGTEEFTRPIMFFNHADHMFWVGKSISDKIVDFRTIQSITKDKRGIFDPFILPIPAEMIDINSFDKIELRKRLRLPLDKRIILTIGSEFKFNSLNRKNLIEPLKQILKNNPEAICIAIGPSSKNPMWKKAYKETIGKIQAIGTINYDKEYFDYIKACDLILDSWPMNGGTVLKDAICCFKPLLSLKNPIGQCDYVLRSKCYCETDDELVQKASDILQNTVKANEYFCNIKEHFLQETDTEAWKQSYASLIKSLPDRHSVINLSNEQEINVIDEYSLLLNKLYSFNIPKIKNTKLFKSRIKYWFYKYLTKNKIKRNKYLKLILEQYLIKN